MANVEYVSRSQLLLQYLLAIEVTVGTKEAAEYCLKRAEVGAIAVDSECLR